MVILHSQSMLIHNLALFGRLLRYRGVNVSSGRIAELVEGLLLVDLRRRDDVYNTLSLPSGPPALGTNRLRRGVRCFLASLDAGATA